MSTSQYSWVKYTVIVALVLPLAVVALIWIRPHNWDISYERLISFALCGLFVAPFCTVQEEALAKWFHAILRGISAIGVTYFAVAAFELPKMVFFVAAPIAAVLGFFAHVLVKHETD